MNDDSPIKEYYPVEFRTDLNGKEQEWEAVVLIPFIDEERLLAAMGEKQSQLTKEVINPRRACARVTVVVLSVCLSVCLCIHLFPL